MLDTEVRLRSGGLGGVPEFIEWQEKLAAIYSSFGISYELLSDKSSNSPLRSAKANATHKEPSLTLLMDVLLEMANNVIPRFLNVPSLTTKRQRARKQGHPKESANPQSSGENGHATSSVARDANLDTAAASCESSDDADSDSSSIMDSSAQLPKDPMVRDARIRAWLDGWRNEVKAAHTLSRLNLLHVRSDRFLMLSLSQYMFPGFFRLWHTQCSFVCGYLRFAQPSWASL